LLGSYEGRLRRIGEPMIWHHVREVPAFSFQSRWRRPGMRRDLPSKMYDWDAGFDGDGVSPGASARSR